MTKLELLTVLYSLEVLHEQGNHEDALKVIKRIISEAESDNRRLYNYET